VRIDMMYRWRTGAIAWLLHRLSGLALAAYLPVHIWVNHHIAKSPEQYDRVMSVLALPVFKALEIGLWGVILYHTLNGMRILLIDLGPGVRYQKHLFWLVVVVGIFLWVVGGYPLAVSFFEKMN